jgi:glycosyltransferase involved in cell wall biosynthesis
MEFALNSRYHADVEITLDGDGQHNPLEVESLIIPIKNGKADIVIGSRFLGQSRAPTIRRIGLAVINWLINIGCESKLTDGQSGYRAYSRKAILQLKTTETGMAFSVETLIKARVQGLRIKEVPIAIKYQQILWLIQLLTLSRYANLFRYFEMRYRTDGNQLTSLGT